MQWEAWNGMAEWLEINFVGTTDWLALPRSLAFLGNVWCWLSLRIVSRD